MISHEEWIRRAQSVELNARLQVRERMAHFDLPRDQDDVETQVAFEHFLRRELRKSLCTEEPSPQVRNVIMHFAAARLRKQQPTRRKSIRDLVAGMLRRSERGQLRQLRMSLLNTRQMLTLPKAETYPVLQIRSDNVITRRISI
jgi:hypothetical protein